MTNCERADADRDRARLRSAAAPQAAAAERSVRLLGDPLELDRATSWMLAHRRAGFLRRHSSTTCASAGGAHGLQRSESAPASARGWRRSRLGLRLATRTPSCPVSISQSTQPNAKDVRARVGVVSLRSAPATYWKVPRIVPCAVIGLEIVGPDVTLNGVADIAPSLFARPKSRSLTPAPVSMMLPGFRSR